MSLRRPSAGPAPLLLGGKVVWCASASGRSGSGVLVVGDVLTPVCLGSLVAGSGLGDGQVGHEVVGGGAVPVPGVGGRGDDVAGSDLLDRAAAGLHQPPYRVWPTACECQAVRAEGVNRTALTRTREGSSPRTMASMKTSPVNQSAGPRAVGGLGWMGTGVSLLRCRGRR